jgi:hypothetical protein
MNRQFPQVVPLTFNTGESHIKIEGFMVPFMNTSFDFRTFNEDGLLLYHKFSSAGFVMVFILFIFNLNLNLNSNSTFLLNSVISRERKNNYKSSRFGNTCCTVGSIRSETE